MLTYAIGFVQNVQLTCFAVVFVLMAMIDRNNRSFRWLAFAYVAGMLGAAFQMGEALLPMWVSIPLFTIAAPVGYACIHAGIVHFVGRGAGTRWVSVILLLGSLPFYVAWSLPAYKARFQEMDRIATLGDFTLAIQTALSAWLLFSTREKETVWPRCVMGAFLTSYSAVEFARVAVYVITGRLPDHAAPWVEAASGIVYVVSCSVLPLNFIWMMNARLHAHMAHQMTTDPLTQLMNRRGLTSAGELEVSRYLRRKQDFAVVLMDLDHFKALNDTHGHAGGDQVLRETATLFRNLIRRTDMIGRLGGEEFVLVLPGTPPSGAARVVENLRLAMEGHRFHVGGKQVRVTASFGIAVSANRDHLTWDALLSEADEALYAAKRGGRNVSRFYQPGFGTA